MLLRESAVIAGDNSFTDSVKRQLQMAQENGCGTQGGEGEGRERRDRGRGRGSGQQAGKRGKEQLTNVVRLPRLQDG